MRECTGTGSRRGYSPLLLSTHTRGLHVRSWTRRYVPPAAGIAPCRHERRQQSSGGLGLLWSGCSAALHVKRDSDASSGDLVEKQRQCVRKDVIFYAKELRS